MKRYAPNSLSLFRSLLVAAALVLAASPLSAQKVETGFLDRAVFVNKHEYRYQVFVPREFTRSKAWPVIIALHGGGSYGSDGIRPTEGGFGRVIRSRPNGFPAIVIFPQAHADGTPGWQLEGGRAVMAALDKAIKEFKGDPKRVVLTGLSAGGNGTWSLASRFPERFAAIVPICSFIFKFKGVSSKVDYPALAPADVGDPYVFIAKKVAAIPVWIFHGDADKTVTVEESRKMTAALKAIGANVKYTEFPGVEHNAWDPAYGRADLIDWMLQQRRP
ncbi:MAG TPA: prolyl oligopeptidase family serine peptidase [Pyrinomonadaceae bacterium]|nr:prolyl oligopeptidase family serine peptidase [Pyrinomonadaceae bacterium]